MQSHQRGRARRVHRDGRALETEGVGDATGDDAGRVARQQVAFGPLREPHPGPVAGRGGTREDSDVMASHGRGVDPGVLERLP